MSGRMGPSFVASLLVSSPVLWMLQQGTLSLDMALQRWAICLGVCWAAISVIGAFAFPDPVARPRVSGDQAEPEQVPADAP